jgi:hypothetical protein
MPFVFAEEARRDMRMLPETLEERWPEIFCRDHFDPDALGCFARPLPDGVESAFREAMPEEARRPDLFRVGWHPFWNRIVLFQKQRTRENDGYAWGVAFIFQGEPIFGKLPDDMAALNADGRYDTFVGQFGEFYAPRSKWDWLELKEIADNHKKWKRGERGKLAASKREAGREDAKRKINDIRHDFLSHYRHLFGAAANEAWGSMSGLPIMGTDDRERDAAARERERFNVEHKQGYKVVDRTLRTPVGEPEVAPRVLVKKLPRAMAEAVQADALERGLRALRGAPAPRPLVETKRAANALKEGV